MQKAQRVRRLICFTLLRRLEKWFAYSLPSGDFIFIFQTSYMTDQVILFTRICAIPGQPSSFGRSVYRSIHDSIKPVKSKVTQNLVPNKTMDCVLQRTNSVDTEGILTSPSTKMPSLPNMMMTARKWATSTESLQQKRVSQPIHLLPILPSTNSSVIAR